MKINILYFSSTGNTLWLMKHFTKIVESKEHTVETFDVMTESGRWEKNCDLLGIIYPVWCSDLPNPIQERVMKMKCGHGKKIFLLGNAGAFSGDTGLYWKKRLKKKQYDVYYANHLILPVNTCFPKFSFFKVPNEEKKKKMQIKAISKLPKICNDILEEKRYMKGRGLIAALGGHGQRLRFYKGLIKGRIREMYIDSKKCINCKLCYKICPTGVIKEVPEIKDKNKCIFCLKCYNLCPVNAVLIEKKSTNTNKYGRYKGPDQSYKPIQYR